MSLDMEYILHSLLTFVLLYRYAGIFLIIFVGSIALPVPSGLVLMASFGSLVEPNQEAVEEE